MPDSLLHRVRRRLRREWRRTSSTWATRAESAAVLRLVAASAAAGVPAAMMLDAWAEDSRGGQGTRLEKAARLLRQGATASETIAAVPGLVQDDHAVALAFGERTGLLGPVVQTALAGDDLLDPTIRRTLRAAVGYLCVVLLVFLAVVSHLTLRINPLFVRILADFDGSRPPAFGLWLAIVWVLAGLLWVPFCLAAVAAAVRFFPSLRRLVIRPFARPRRSVAALDLLAVGAERGLEPAAAAEMLAACQIDPVLTARLAQVGAAAAPLGSRLAEAGLVSPDEATDIDAAGSDGPVVVRRIASDRRLRRRRRLTAFGEAIVPAVVVVMGLLVLLQALAVFSFLTGLIHDLA